MISEWQHLKKNIAYTYQKNVYLQRIEETRVSNRTIQKALNYRNPLYREATKLLFSYRKLINNVYSRSDIQKVLNESFITSGNQDISFELYSIVQVIKQNTQHLKSRIN